MGHGLCAERCLEALVRTGVHDIGLVVPGNRPEQKVRPIKRIAERYRLPTRQPKNANDFGFVETIRGLAPDLIICVSFTEIFGRELIHVPRLGCINVHGALLPQYRGLHAHNWTIVNGETETGATIHYIDQGVDSGDIIAQSRVEITLADDAFTVREKVTKTAPPLLLETVRQIEEGSAPRLKQDEALARCWPPRKPEHGAINWTASSWKIFNLIRALVPPWPGAFTSFRGSKLIVWEAEPVDVCPGGSARALPGEVCDITEEGLLVAAGSGQVLMRNVQAEGEDALPTAAFAERNALSIGERLN